MSTTHSQGGQHHVEREFVIYSGRQTCSLCLKPLCPLVPTPQEVIRERHTDDRHPGDVRTFWYHPGCCVIVDGKLETR